MQNKEIKLLKKKINQIGENIHSPFGIDHSKFLQYDYILKVLKEIQQRLITKYTNQNLKSQTQQRKGLSTFVYKLLLGLFEGRPKQDLYCQQKSSIMFLQPRPSKFCLYIEAFIDYLHDQSPILSPSLLLDIISKKIKKQISNQQSNASQSSSSRQQLKLTYQCQQQKKTGDKVYSYQCKTKITKISNNLSMIKLRTSKSNWEDRKDQIEEIKYRINGMLQRQSGINFMNELFQTIISIFYIENFINGVRQPDVQFTHFEMHCPSYSKIAITKSFQLAIIQQKEQLIIQVIIPKWELTLVPPLQAQKYFQEVKKLIVGSSNNLQAKFHNGLYLIDKQNKLGKGSYGVVCSGTELRLQRVKKESNDLKTYWLSKSQIAIKKMPLEKGQRNIPQNRQHLILTLIRQIQHKQSILSTQRQLGLFVRNSTVGAFKIAKMIDYFRQEQNVLIVFEQLKPIVKDSLLQFNHLFNYQLCIWQSLHFLQYQIAEYYPEQLDRYFSLQKSEKRAEYSGSGKPIGICHRDIKPTNILKSLNESNQYILIDFGFACIMAQRQDHQQSPNSSSSSSTKGLSLARSGSQYYMAPEIPLGNYTYRADQWSFGVVLFDKRSQILKKYKFYYAGLQIKNIPFRREEIQRQLSEQSGIDIWSNFLYYSIRIDPDKRRSPKEGITYLLKNANRLQKYQFFENNKSNINNMLRVSDILQNSLWPVSIQLQIVQRCYGEFINNVDQDLKDFINFLSTATVNIDHHGNQVDITVIKGQKRRAQKSIQCSWQYLRLQQVTSINKKYVVLIKWPILMPYDTDNSTNHYSNLRFGVYLTRNISTHIRLFNISVANLSQPANEDTNLIIEQVNISLLIRTKCSIKQSIFWIQSQTDGKQIDIAKQLLSVNFTQIKQNCIQVKVKEFDSLFCHSNLTEIANWNHNSSIININSSSLNLFMQSFINPSFKNRLLKFIEGTKGWTSQHIINFNLFYWCQQKEQLNFLIRQYEKQQSLYPNQRINKILQRFKNIFHLFLAIQTRTFYRIKIQRIIKGFKQIQNPSQYQHNQLMEQLFSLTKNRNLIQSLLDCWKTCRKQTLKYQIAEQAEEDYHQLLRIKRKKNKQPQQKIEQLQKIKYHQNNLRGSKCIGGKL